MHGATPRELAPIMQAYRACGSSPSIGTEAG
jgi:hypothetical protein